MPYGILLKDKRRTWNILIFKMIRLLRHHFSHSTFDVGRSFFSVNLPPSIRRKNNLALMALCSLPHALCSLPSALRPMLFAPCSLLYALCHLRGQHLITGIAEQPHNRPGASHEQISDDQSDEKKAKLLKQLHTTISHTKRTAQPSDKKTEPQ